MYYRASMEFRHENGAGFHEIVFSADDEKDAIQSVGRWILNRQKNVPEVFGEILSVKVSICIISTIRPDGYLVGDRYHSFFQWKYDDEKTLEEAIEKH